MTAVKKYGYLWATLMLFLVSLVGHWVFGWQTFVQEQEDHNQAPHVQAYVNEMLRDTLENWQSEFLQLMWQVAGLAFLWYVGSPQSKESDERNEEKLDWIMDQLSVHKARDFKKKLDAKYPKK